MPEMNEFPRSNNNFSQLIFVIEFSVVILFWGTELGGSDLTCVPC